MIAEFLSTPSGWRATSKTAAQVQTVTRISIHALRVEGDAGKGRKRRRKKKISIHALRVEGDLRVVLRLQAVVQFLSTPSGWRATLR